MYSINATHVCVCAVIHTRDASIHILGVSISRVNNSLLLILVNRLFCIKIQQYIARYIPLKPYLKDIYSVIYLIPGSTG